MTLTVGLLLKIIALICFAIGAWGWTPRPAWNWVAAGLFFWLLADTFFGS